MFIFFSRGGEATLFERRKTRDERERNLLPVASSSIPFFLPLLIANRAKSNNKRAPRTDPTTAPAIPPFEIESFFGFGRIEPGEEIEAKGAVERGDEEGREEDEELEERVEVIELLLRVEEPLKNGIEENEGRVEMVEN